MIYVICSVFFVFIPFFHRRTQRNINFFTVGRFNIRKPFNAAKRNFHNIIAAFVRNFNTKIFKNLFVSISYRILSPWFWFDRIAGFIMPESMKYMGIPCALVIYWQVLRRRVQSNYTTYTPPNSQEKLCTDKNKNKSNNSTFFTWQRFRKKL